MGFVRWLARRFRGVQDFALNADDHSDPRRYVYYTIERAPFQFWVVFVAGVGFLTDAYDIFALNFLNQILPYVYWEQDGVLKKRYQAGLLISGLVGILLGQVIFGFLGDKYGRRKMYGLELIILIVGSIGTAMASQGEEHSMNILGWLVAWRIIMGIGIGADYPLVGAIVSMIDCANIIKSAIITSEFAPSKHRARMLASVFWMQPIGQVIVLAVALVVIRISQPNLQNCTQPLSRDCIRSLDMAWRWVVGLGAVPAAIAIFFRLTIPQSPRFLMDNAKKERSAMIETAAYFASQSDSLVNQVNVTAPLTQQPEESIQEPEMIQLPPAALDSNAIGHEERRASRASGVSSLSSAPSVTNHFATQAAEHNSTWLTQFKKYFFVEGNWRLLAGTAGTWFLLDIPFYGLNLSYTHIVDAIWQDPGCHIGPDSSVYLKLYESLWHQLVVVTAGALLGGGIFLKIIKHISPKTIQFWGFVILTVLLLVTGVAFEQLRARDGTGLIFLYVLIQLFFNLGPNTTTYLIPAELFSTQYRCFGHGFSAAAGRAGAIVAQIFITFATFDNNATLADAAGESTTGNATTNDASLQAPNSSTCIHGERKSSQTLGRILAVFCVFTALGACLTLWLTPETRDVNGDARSLETLAKGYRHLKELGKNPDPEDKFAEGS